MPQSTVSACLASSERVSRPSHGVIVSTWYMPGLNALVPQWLEDWMYPIDKTNLDRARVSHSSLGGWSRFGWCRVTGPCCSPGGCFQPLCAASILWRFFCLGVFLSIAAHFAMVEINQGVGMQIAMSLQELP